jgi:predicted patatin/cPLA2 family phospholipase
MKKPLAVERVLSSPIPFNAGCASVQCCESAVLTGFTDPESLFEALRCSARIPFFAGPPGAFRGDVYLDPSLYAPIPFAAAVASGATDVVVLLTRPEGQMRHARGLIDRMLVMPYLRRLDPRLAQQYRETAKRYRQELATIIQRADAKEGLRFLPIRIPPLAGNVHPFETDRGLLVRGAMDGFSAVYSTFERPAPHLTETITPIEQPEDST